jgi:sterol desaturase/sphingolipid hydroxylase (fatty acid hydroxylase superfamily)
MFTNFLLYEILSFVYWINLYNMLALLDNAIFEIGTMFMLPVILISFLRITSWIHFAFTALMVTRLFLFEYLYYDTPYMTTRNTLSKHTIYDRFCLLSSHVTKNEKHCLCWSLIACMFVHFPEGPLIIFLSLKDTYTILCDTLCIFIVSDFCFYIFHRLSHVPLVYKYVHFLHHKLGRPTSYSNCETFTLVDGIGHVFVYHAGFTIFYSFLRTVHPENTVLYTTIWIIAGLQWFIFGQCEHGGKDIPIRLIPGLNSVRFVFRICSNTPKLHDIHHTLLNVNFSLTGIFDRCFGTLKENHV